jgi:hypothetical protein
MYVRLIARYYCHVSEFVGDDARSKVGPRDCELLLTQILDPGGCELLLTQILDPGDLNPDVAGFYYLGI